MKMLVVFYSLEGNIRFIADNIASAAGADLLELKPEKEIAKEKNEASAKARKWAKEIVAKAR